MPQASTSERVGNSRPWSAGMFSKSSFENKGNNHNAFFVPKTFKMKQKRSHPNKMRPIQGQKWRIDRIHKPLNIIIDS